MGLGRGTGGYTILSCLARWVRGEGVLWRSWPTYLPIWTVGWFRGLGNCSRRLPGAGADEMVFAFGIRDVVVMGVKSGGLLI